MITINIDEEGARVDINKDDRRTQKYLTVKSLQNCILRNYKTDSGLLPQGTVAFMQNGKEIRVAMVQNAGIKDVQYDSYNSDTGSHTISAYRIPIPPLLWIFKLTTKKIVIETKVFALDGTFLCPDTTIYNAPFSNIYAGGKVCWGSDSFLNEPIKILLGLSSLPDIFFSKPFNIDLDNYGCLELFKKSDKKDKFDMGYLVRKSTFKEIWDEN